ncbi:gamma-glutamyl-gamma-aminobutyrate hydrolase family protein [Pyramidobacter sp. CG50-2]|uniref:gamma-glutamyl-gamma-aminobutyrate hydrolase family protein n=1 Tax=Pyramidobacter sp. CG50-2 TaxID=2382160 RepID=UPI0013152531|nr:gamma-glutamyl-gamma-aminobutyrate hydrolase family protein [Pyramidobacter sp. CG50-2]
MAERTLIAVACNLDCPGTTPIVGVYNSYTGALTEAGGAPFIVPDSTDEALLAQYLDMAGGLFVPGGIDVWPMLYGQGPDAKLGRLDPGLDLYQIALIKLARARRMPVFGVCRGVQIMNVALGGTLIQHLGNDPVRFGHQQNMPGRWPSHEATAEKDSLVGALFGEKFSVNSFHHQALDALAPGFRATAWAPDGVIEAFEAEDGSFCMGVQWHPERMIHDFPADLNLFRRFVEEAAKYRAVRRRANGNEN